MDCKTEERRLLDLEQKDADRRFHDLFRSGVIHPDFLLGILFERRWPAINAAAAIRENPCDPSFTQGGSYGS